MTPSYNKGDVLLVSFPFTDFTRSKKRPAIVVSGKDYNQGSPDLLVISVTGNPKPIPHVGDHFIQHWKAAGLIKKSWAQTKVATIELRVVVRRLGTLHPDDLKAVDAGLGKALEL